MKKELFIVMFILSFPFSSALYIFTSSSYNEQDEMSKAQGVFNKMEEERKDRIEKQIEMLSLVCSRMFCEHESEEGREGCINYMSSWLKNGE